MWARAVCWVQPCASWGRKSQRGVTEAPVLTFGSVRRLPPWPGPVPVGTSWPEAEPSAPCVPGTSLRTSPSPPSTGRRGPSCWSSPRSTQRISVSLLWPAMVPWADVDLSPFWASCLSGPGAEPGWGLEDGRGRGWVFRRESQLPPAVALLPRPGRLGGVPHAEDAHGDGDDQVSGSPLWEREGGPTGAALGAGRAGAPAALRGCPLAGLGAVASGGALGPPGQHSCCRGRGDGQAGDAVTSRRAEGSQRVRRDGDGARCGVSAAGVSSRVLPRDAAGARCQDRCDCACCEP